MSGKTHFGCTAPDPIAFFGLDEGHEGIVGDFQRKGKKIATRRFDHQVPLTKKMTSEEMQTASEHILKEVWRPFQEAFDKVVKSGMFRTIVLDTANEVNEIIKLANFGKIAQISQYAYPYLNNEFAKLVKEPAKHGINLVLLSHLKDEYKTAKVFDVQKNEFVAKDERTGRRIGAGNSKVFTLVDDQVRTLFTPTKDGPKFELEVKKARRAPEMVGQTIEALDFVGLMTLLHPEVPLEAWEEGK